jgi:uncharacterized protein involved in tolerance to divalent cations
VLLLPVLLLQGKLERDSELLLIIKTQAALLDSLTTKVGGIEQYNAVQYTLIQIFR